jgi:hypothetical protein
MPPVESGQNLNYNLPDPISEANGDINNPEIVRGNNTVNPEKAKISQFSKMASTNQATVLQPSNSIIQDDDFSVSDDTSLGTSQLDNPQIAEDGDLIEKEWVEKAKKIIEDNREDPYKQSKEMNIFKSDYMKKRYNRTVRTED